MATIFFTDIDDDWTPSLDQEANEDDEFHGAGGNDILRGDRWFGIAGGRDLIFGDAGDDQLTGGLGADTLHGGTGNDTISGDGHAEGFPDYDRFDGADIIYGGAGNDSITAEGGNDTLIGGAGADTLDGGSGIDTADYTGSSAAVRVVIGEVGQGGDAAGDVLRGNIEILKGSFSFGDLLSGWTTDDDIHGQGGDDTLYGQQGEDRLFGGDGNDELFGQEGEDRFFGGDGRDRVSYSYQSQAVIIAIGVGTGAGGDASGDFIALDVEDIVGSDIGGDILTGSGADNALDGRRGDDTLRGEGGSDTLLGGGGNDRLSGGAGGDRLDGGAGIDQADYSSAASGVVADMIAISVNQGDAFGDSYFNIENLKGSNFNDILLGNDLDNSLGGNNGGNDQLSGRSGNDTLAGGNGTDTLLGGLGNDTYLLDDTTAPSAIANLRYDTIVEDAGAGVDLALVNSDAPSSAIAPSYTLAANLEHGTLTGSTSFSLRGNELDNRLTGNGANNRLTGQTGSDTLSGGLGQDTLDGGLGNDRYILNDTFIDGIAGSSRYDDIGEAGGGGVDTVVVNSNAPSSSLSPSYTLGAGLEHGVVGGSGEFTLRGNEAGNRLIGNDAANRLSGLAGADRLEGGLGSDTLEGGAGNDIYVLDDVFAPSPIAVEHYDTVLEAPGGGTDTVRVSQQGGQRAYTLGADIENGTVTGTAAFNLVGNGLNNTLIGNIGANGLRAGNGNDRIDGDAGIDTLFGGAGADTISGGYARDLMTGNAGADVFDYNLLGESLAVNAGRDTISDFQHLVDTLDFATLDANTATAANDSFVFRASAGFTAASQIRATQAGAHTLVELNLTGPAAAEMSVLLLNFTANTLTTADFVL